MGTENGYSFKETLSKSFGLSDKLRMSGCLGEKTDTESKNKANESVREILQTSFAGKYDSVESMLLIKHTNASGEAKDNAANALLQIGLTLSQNNEILKAAVEGIDELHKKIPSRLHGIQPFILSVALTNGKDDVKGQDRVIKLVELFKLKKKYETTGSEKDRTTFESKADDFSDELYENYENASEKDNIDGTVGRIELTLGWTRRMRESLKTEGVPSVKPVSTERRDKTSVSEDEEVPERFEPEQPEPVGFDDGDGEGKKKGRGFSYGPEKPEFSRAIIRGLGTDLRVNSPPRWLNELEEGDKLWYEMAHYLSQCSENKTALKDSVKGTEKLWLDDNLRTKVNESDLKIMYERFGFRVALEKFIGDLCVLKKDDSNGSEFLYLRPEKDSDGKLIISNMLLDIDTYKQEVAMSICIQKAYSRNSDGNELFSKEILHIMNLQGLSREQALIVWKKLHDFDEAQIEVGTAWNFLYNCDFVESADFSRELGPIDGVKGDAANFIFHPDAKVSSKLTDKKMVVGKDEIKGGPLADWYDYQLIHDKDFRIEYEKSGDRRLFPKRLGVGFLDTYKVKTDKGEMSMAKALIEHETIDFSNKKATKSNIFKDYKDMREGSLITFKYLTGQMPVDIKNRDQWAIEAQNAVTLLRQQAEMPDGKILPIVDDVRLYAAMIYSSAGIDQRDKLLTIKADFMDYKEGLLYLTRKGFIKSTDKNRNTLINPYTTKFQREVFNFIYKGVASRTVNKVFG